MLKNETPDLKNAIQKLMAFFALTVKEHRQLWTIKNIFVSPDASSLPPLPCKLMSTGEPDSPRHSNSDINIIAADSARPKLFDLCLQLCLHVKENRGSFKFKCHYLAKWWGAESWSEILHPHIVSVRIRLHIKCCIMCMDLIISCQHFRELVILLKHFCSMSNVWRKYQEGWLKPPMPLALIVTVSKVQYFV